MKRTLFFLLAAALCLSLAACILPAPAGASFSDVKPGRWYYDAVTRMEADGVLTGYPDGTFRPGSPITRAQMAVMLVNMREIEPVSSETPRFPDVAQTHWAYKYVEAAAREGFISGYQDGTFRPDRNVTYDEALTMIVALMGYTLKDLGGSYPTAFTNKARDLGILNTCAILGSEYATRANVSCFLRDAILASKDDYDVFKYVGSGYKITLGRDDIYTNATDIGKKKVYYMIYYLNILNILSIYMMI